MALGRVTVWNSGQVLTAAAQNGEFNNILNNPIALISPTTGAINFNLQTHTNLLPSALTGTSGSSGNVLTLSAGLIPGWGAGASGSSNSNPPVGSYVTGLVGLISSQLATFAADQYLLRTTQAAPTASFSMVATSSFGVNIATAGITAGGRDVVAAFSSTEVHWYVISTGLNSTVAAGLVSSQRPPTGPVMPTSYSAWTYLGASPYTSASTTVVADHYVRGPKAIFAPFQPTTVISTNPITEVTLSLSSQVPSNAETISLRVGSAQTGGGTILDPMHIRITSSVDVWTQTVESNTTTVMVMTPIEVPNVGQAIIYQSASSAGANAPGITIEVLGWKNPIGR